MTHDNGEYSPRPPSGFFRRLWWRFVEENPRPAPHGDACDYCRGFFNQDDIPYLIQPVRPWPDPPPPPPRGIQTSPIGSKTMSINAIKKRAENATRGPWTPHRIVKSDGTPPTFDEFAEYSKQCLSASLQTDIYYVSCVKEDGGADVAHVGNGPDSEANSVFIAHARQDILLLLDVVEAAKGVLDYEKTVETGGHPWAALANALKKLEVG